MNEMISRNRMSAVALMQSENADIDFVNNPHTGKIFFTCGAIQSGYISPAVRDALEEGTLTADDMQYAECSSDNGVNWVPCLMMIGDTRKNVVKTFSRN